ncbi:transposase [Umezakia ovalisporum]|uniref:transposase n=1 Tax=Umezakia ovalisporum TaxID=75695 RepID=UPI002476728E|nr:transposase [Umezakia ovalisporum]MDH6084806.1 transposase [Umezakia ovalisporum TAC611]
MQTVYQYKLRLTKQPAIAMHRCLPMVGNQYNYLLGDRFHWYEQNPCAINFCQIFSHFQELAKNPNYKGQIKKTYLLYQDIYSRILQNNVVKRFKVTCNPFLNSESKGKLSNKGRFKSRDCDPTLGDPQMQNGYLQSNLINRLKLNNFKLILHNPLPVGFKIKIPSIIKKPVKQLGKQYQKLADKCKNFYVKTVKKLLSKYYFVLYENLNVKALSKFMHDDGWLNLLSIITITAQSAGLLVISVNTSANFPDCYDSEAKIRQKFHEKWYECPSCGCGLDHNHNTTININNMAVEHAVFKAQLTSPAMAGVAEKPTLYAIASV